MGDKRDARFSELYAVDRSRRTLLGDLDRLGVRPEEVDVVVLSHLHFDHAGGCTRMEGGRAVPVFPRATVVVQEGMWAEALDPNPRTKGSYFPEDFLPLEAAGRMRFIRGDEEVAPGVFARLSGGHVKHHQIVTVESEGRKAVFWADLLPTVAHVKPAWTMGYDLYPHEVATLRARLVDEAVEGRWISVFEHDPSIAMATFEREGKGVRVVPVERLEGGG
jgi:glyoxylase-like metal-dependent hydrolase (beta-lactamase superfamily II)